MVCIRTVALIGVVAVGVAPKMLLGAEPVREPQELTETFLEQVGGGEVEKALDALPKGVIWASQPQKLELLRGQIKTGVGLYGKYLGIERVRETRHSPSVTRLAYVMKFEQHFLVWNLVFYKPKDRWESTGVYFSDQPNALE